MGDPSTITGVISDATGSPVEGARVFASREDDETLTLFYTTGADGAYSIDVDQDGFGSATYCMSASAPASAGVYFGPSGWTPKLSERECILLGEAPLAINVTLPQFVSVQGKVVGSNDAGCPGMRLLADPLADDEDLGVVVNGEESGGFAMYLLPGDWSMSDYPTDRATTTVTVAASPITDVQLILDGPC